VVVLSGGPGVGRSNGGPHTMAQAVADLEEVRSAAGIERWTVLGHSWDSDLAVRYALDHPESVVQVVGIAGHGLHKDRTWSAQYESGRATDPASDITWSAEVHAALQASFLDSIHEPRHWRKLADSRVPMTFLAAGADIRPPWPLAQLGELVPHGRFETVPDVPHDFWHTHPELWREVVTATFRPS
jgi:proline iminopeptidase